MFLNQRCINRKRIFVSPIPLFVEVPKADKDGFVSMDIVDLNDVVTSQQQLSIPTDLDMCKRLGINLETVSVSLDPTDKATIERNVEFMTSQLDDDTFTKIFNESLTNYQNEF